MSENAEAKGPSEAGPMSRYTRVAPCPFCGSDVEADRDDMTGLVTVGCDRPGCCILDTSYGNEAEAIAAWNRRAGPSPEALEAENKRLRGLVEAGISTMAYIATLAENMEEARFEAERGARAGRTALEAEDG